MKFAINQTETVQQLKQDKSETYNYGKSNLTKNLCIWFLKGETARIYQIIAKVACLGVEFSEQWINDLPYDIKAKTFNSKPFKL